MCSTYNIRVKAGDILARSFTFTHATDSTPVDMTIYNGIKMQVRKLSGTTVICEASTALGNFTITGADNNIVNLDLLQIPTTPGTYKYDIEFTNTGLKDTLLEGNFIITPQITV